MIEENKQRIISLLTATKVEGMDKLIMWLESSDFFTAPASTRFHLSCKGGLAQHSLNVYDRLVREVRSEYGSITKSPFEYKSIVIVALLHDMCKVDFYKVSTRNQKDDATGKWEKVPYYSIEEHLPIPHSFKSQYIVRSYIPLTREESIAIMSHMGLSDSTIKGGDRTIGDAMEQYPLALLLHIADMKAANIDEGKELP